MTAPARLAASKQISLTTYRKNGAAVATPVWHVANDNILTTVSAADAGKVKRIRNNPRVQVTPCDIRGRTAPGAVALPATATLLPPSETEAARRLMETRYLTARIGGWFVRMFHLRTKPAVAIIITL